MLSTRQHAILDVFLKHPDQKKSMSDFSGLPVDRTTLFRDLKKMTESGLLIATGKTYTLNPSSTPYLQWDLSRAPSERPAIRYNPALLDRYRANETFLLTEVQLTQLEQSGAPGGSGTNPPAKHAYERILSSLLIDLSHASSRLENVNISWLDTKTLIEFGERPNGLTDSELRIVLNHKEAVRYLIEHRTNIPLSRRTILDFHSLLTQGLIKDVSAIGALRSVVVKFDDSSYLPPANPHQLRDIFDQFCDTVSHIQNPYEQAFFAMAFLPYIQPFQDGNKRTSRLIMNAPLIQHDLPPFSFSGIKKRDYLFGLLAFYERGRHEFLSDAFVSAYMLSSRKYLELLSYVSEGGLLDSVSDIEYNKPTM